MILAGRLHITIALAAKNVAKHLAFASSVAT
jgi:hypothetical protein